MSRALIHSRLAETLGIPVLANWSKDESPTRSSMFAILRWGPENAPKFDRGNHTQDLTVWVHMPQEIGSDFLEIQEKLKQVKNVLTSIEQEVGVDGYEVHSLKWQGSSDD